MHVLFSNKLHTSMLLTIDCNTDLLLCALIQTALADMFAVITSTHCCIQPHRWQNECMSNTESVHIFFTVSQTYVCKSHILLILLPSKSCHVC